MGALAVPQVVVRLTVALPEPGGDWAVTCVDETRVTCVAAEPPNETVELASKLLPLMVTVVPPVAGPLVGEMEEIVGGGGLGVTVRVKDWVAVGATPLEAVRVMR